MANTRADIVITKSVWTDLYVSAGITVGTPLTIINKGSSTVLVAVSLAAPTDERGFPLWPADAQARQVSVTQGEAGLWVKATDSSGLLMVQEF